MQEYISFILAHPLKVTAFGVILAAIIVFEFGKGKKALSLDTTKAVQMINDDDTVLIDIRPSSQFNDGHISGAHNVGVSEIKSRIEKLCKDKETKILLYCNTGISTNAAANQLVQLGYSNLYSIGGGIRAWQQANLPLKKGKK